MTGKQKLDYAVIIVNYNSAEDTLLAIDSIKNNTNKEYCICVVDNQSSKTEEVATLQNKLQKDGRCLFFVAPKNGGYAYGNNYGVRKVLELYDVDHLVIMNPDVVIPEYEVIDNLVDKLKELPTEYAGVQPWHYVPHQANTPANMYKAFRKLPNYADIVLMHTMFLKRLFPDYIAYEKQRPYDKEMDFEVPSGAFFVIRTESFVDIGMFDERTFLYAEEYILGFKIKEHGQKFLLIPNVYIIHEGGKSIGSSYSKPNWRMVKYSIQAMGIYLKHYLKCNKLKIKFIQCLKIYDFALKSAYAKLFDTLKNDKDYKENTPPC